MGEDAIAVGAGTAERGHIVMAVASTIDHDSRVRKTALAAADAGYRVTLVWGDYRASEVVEGDLGPVRTIGVPVPYLLRDQRAARIAQRRGWRPGWPGYRDRTTMRAGAVRLAAASARVEGRSVLARGVLRVHTFSHRVRSRVFRTQVRWFADFWQRRDLRRLATLDRLDWRKELANIADLEAAFTGWLLRLEPDLLHVHDIHLLGAGVQAKRGLARRGRSVPLVYDAHEYIPGMAGRSAVTEAAYRAMEAELVGSADAVVTVSEPIADALLARYDLPKRPVVVLNSPSARAGARCASDVRSAAGVGAGIPLLVYAGGVGPLRNVSTVVRALASLEGVHFAIVCVPSPMHGAAQRLVSVAEGEGVRDRVHLLEPVAPEEIIDFLATADVGVHPMVAGLANHEMALPNKLFDYVYAGLPVAVSNVAEMDRFVHEWGLGETFDPSDPEALAAAVRKVLADLPGYSARTADRDLRNQYSWESQVARLGVLYADMSEAREKRDNGM